MTNCNRISPVKGGCPFCGQLAVNDPTADYSKEWDVYLHVTCLENELRAERSKWNPDFLDSLALEFAALLRARRANADYPYDEIL